MRLPSQQELEWFAAIGAGVGALYSALRKFVYPILARMVARIWTPIREHFAGINRMVEKVDRIDARCARVEGEVTQIKTRVDAELGPNGGGSMKDLVTIIEARQSSIFDGMERAGFQTNANGHFVHVNRAFEKLTGFPARNLLGMQWVNLLHQDEVEDFMAVWYHVIKEGRPLRRTCRIVTADRDEILVYVDANPVTANGRVREWQGTFCKPEAIA